MYTKSYSPKCISDIHINGIHGISWQHNNKTSMWKNSKAFWNAIKVFGQKIKMARDCLASHSSYLTEHKDSQTGLKLSSLETMLKKTFRQVWSAIKQSGCNPCAKTVGKRLYY